MVAGKKKVLLLICVLLTLAGVLPAVPGKTSAQDKNQQELQEASAVVIDDASLLQEEEKIELQKRAEAFSKESGFSVIIATCFDARGESAQTVGEEYYNTYAAGDDGITCLLDMDNREIRLVTTGKAVSYLTDKRIERVVDEAYNAVSRSEYKECLVEMLDGAESYYKRGVPDNQKIYNKDTGEVTVNRRITFMEFLIAIGAGIGAAGAVAIAIYGKYRLKFNSSSYDIHKSGHLELEREEDRFVNQIVTHHHIQRDQGGGGSGGNTSTTHSGSGGRSFGGGGRKF